MKLNRDPEIPVTMGEEPKVSTIQNEALLHWSNSRGTPSFPPKLREEHEMFPSSSLSKGANFPASIKRGILSFPLHLRGPYVTYWKSRETLRFLLQESNGSQVSPQLEIRPDSPATTPMEPRVSLSQHEGTCLTAIFAPLENSRVLCLNSTGGLTPSL